jgi:hypothetical protein
MAFGKAALCAALIAGALAGVPAALAQVEAPDPGDKPATSAGPLEPGELASGAIDVSGDVDVFSLELASAPAMLDIEVGHTNNTCEIWATLLDSGGNELRRIFVPRQGALTLNTIAFLAGAYYVAVSTGPYVECSGATYSVQLFEFRLPDEGLTSPDPGEAQRAARRWGVATACAKARAKAERLGDRRRALLRKVKLAEGAAKRRYEKRLKKVTRLYYAAKAEAAQVCKSTRRSPEPRRTR